MTNRLNPQPPPDGHDPVVDAIEDYLAAQARGQRWSPELLKDRLGSQWSEVQECLELIGGLSEAADLLADHASPMPHSIAGFEILNQVGKGGFSTVLLGVDPALDLSLIHISEPTRPY